MSIPFLTPQTIMKVRPDADVSCRLCARVIELCDGQRTLREVAQALHLTQSACVKLVQRSMSRDWLEPVEYEENESAASFNYWFVVSEHLVQSIGSEGGRLLYQAAQMMKRTPGTMVEADVEEYLIAVELSADEQQRKVLVPLLDTIREKFLGH